MTGRPQPLLRPDARPVLPGFYRVIPSGDGAQLRSAGRVVSLKGDLPAALVAAIVSDLDGCSTVTELAMRHGLDVDAILRLLEPLAAAGVVEDAADWVGLPDTGGVRDHVADIGEDAADVHARLAAAKVAVVGMSPVAGMVANHLAEAGVGIRVWEEPLDTADAASLMAEVDLVVVDADDAGTWVDAVNTACLGGGSRALPYHLGSRQVVIGPLLTGSRPCYECARSRRESHLQHHGAFTEYKVAVSEGLVTPAPPVLLSAHLGAVAGMVAVEALRVTGQFGVPATAGNLLTFDAASLEVHAEYVLEVPGCPACGSSLDSLA